MSYLSQLIPGKHHISYGIKNKHYYIGAEILLCALEQGLGDAFTNKLKAAGLRPIWL